MYNPIKSRRNLCMVISLVLITALLATSPEVGAQGAGKDSPVTVEWCKVVSTNPSNVHIKLNFSNGIDDNLAANLSKITLMNNTTGKAVQLSASDFRYMKSGSRHDPSKPKLRLLDFNKSLDPGTTYTITVGSGIEANNGNKSSSLYSWQFTTSRTATGSQKPDAPVSSGTNTSAQAAGKSPTVMSAEAPVPEPDKEEDQTVAQEVKEEETQKETDRDVAAPDSETTTTGKAEETPVSPEAVQVVAVSILIVSSGAMFWSRRETA